MAESLEQRVEAVITSVDLGRADFAASIGIDASKLSKSLSGRRRFSSLELARIAEVGRRSVDWLITGREPFRPVFAQRARLAGADDETGARTVELLAAGVRGLAAVDRPLVRPELPQLARRSSWYTVEAAELARRFVPVIGRPLGGMPTHDLISAIERVFGVMVVVTDLPEGIDGLSYEDAQCRVILLATTDRPLRQRFTLAHELAHIAFGDARQGMLEEQMGTARSNVERRANSFAAAFLAPTDELGAAIGERSTAAAFPELVEHFQLSPESMAWRLFNEKRIDETVRAGLNGLSARSIYMQLGKAAEYVDLSHAAGEPRPSWLLVNAALDAYRDGDTTVKPVATLLGWAPQDAEEFFALDDGSTPIPEAGVTEN